MLGEPDRGGWSVGSFVIGERPRNYALIPYEPPTPVEGRPRSSNLLAELSDAQGSTQVLRGLLDRSSDEFGPSSTVWGLKVDFRQSVDWELYFYDHQCGHGPLTVDRVARVVGVDGSIPSGGLDQLKPIFSLSIDVDPGARPGAMVTALHAYAPQPSEPATCISYKAVGGHLEMENVYYLISGGEMASRVDDFVRSSLFPVAVTELIGSLIPCDHVAWAHKPRTEGIYFGGITADQFRWFLDRFNFPGTIVDVVSAFGSELDHLLFDVGVDFGPRCAGIPTKVAFYGYF